MKAVKRAILLCWFMLVVCLVIKLIGGNWFEIICNNEHFIYVCKFVDEHWYIRYPIGFIIYVVSAFFIILSSSLITKPSIKQALYIFVSSAIVWSSSLIPLKITTYIKFALEVVLFVTSPFMLHIINNGFVAWKTTIKKTWYLGIIGCVLTFLFQFLSVLTRNIGIKVIDTNFLTTFILMIDYYIMILLYYLYVKLKTKKEET